ncbi:hypothetical protein [Azospirillum thermophilum]|uniref:Uncharacterized protein n=1 Tax=Azospirillum thermophilum TaxID=2202148 RepID=A0A2S2CZX2_9PROT|nr:hypothetical protein [Azospirillum thermophilum]AWK90064.1 hypothetical protein DEW08_29190 [Azospirillum thermophilum]
MTLTPRIHGLIDWAATALLAAAPTALGWRGDTRRLMHAASAGTAAYALATDYEWGAAPLLSMEQHLALDAAQGAGFLVAALSLRREPLEARIAMAAFGAVAIAAAAFTERHPVPRARQRRYGRDSAILSRREAAARLSLADAPQ